MRAGTQPSTLVDRSLRESTLDAFGRLRVSTPHSLFDSKQNYDSNPLHFVTSTAGAGAVTHVVLKAASELTTTTGASDRAIRQTKRYWNYQSGKGMLVNVTYNLEGGETNVRKEVGYFDDSNGIFLRLLGASALSIVRRSKVTGAVVDDVIAQGAWNIDPMDGTGPSGKTLSLTAVQILQIDFEWLGAGSALVCFVIDGKVFPVHRLDHANVLATVWMQTPNLPVRWEITNFGVAVGTPKLTSICCSIMVEGGVEATGTTRSANRGSSVVSVPGTFIPIISLRLKPTHDRASVRLAALGLLNLVKEEFLWQLVLNPVVTGGVAAAWVGQTDSAVEVDIARDGVVSGGIVLESGYQEQLATLTRVLDTQVFLASDFAGVPDVCMLAAQSISGVNSSVVGGMTWIESQ